VTTDLRGFVVGYNAEDKAKFPNGYEKGRYWGYCYFQGFPEEFQFGPFSENPCRFSLWTGNEYEVYTLLWLLLRDRRTRARG